MWCIHHHHQVPDLEQTLATMPLQTSLSSDNFKKFKPLLCPPVAELQRLSRNVIRCLPLSRLPSTLPVKDKNSKPLRLHKCPKNYIVIIMSTAELILTQADGQNGRPAFEYVQKNTDRINRNR